MSGILSAELAATCSALGYYDATTKKYYADENTLETVKDLIRYLRRDDENHEIRRQLGDTKVLQTDLLPMLKSYWEETELFDVLLRLLVNLTTPAIVLWNEEIPTEKITRNYYMQIVDHLKCYKEAFVDPDVWSVLSRRISKTLEIDYGERGDEKSLIIERILILLRNVLYVPIDPHLERPDDDASVHDQVLWSLHQSGMLDIILYISSSPSEQAYYMHILEILCFMLREQRASDLAQAALQRSETEKIRDEAELVAIRHREALEKQKKIKKYNSTRHSRFGGTYVVTSMKSISDNELIYHKPLNKIDELNFDTDKKRVKTPKNRMPISCPSMERRSAFSVRLFLKEFCIEFLNGAYNTFINYVKNTLVRGKGQNNDESYYFWAVRFFMEINRSYKFDIKLVSETMSIQTFHYIQREMEKQFDMMQTDKKHIRLSSRRLHLALLAYRELLLTLCAMDRSQDEGVKNSSKVIKSNLFYVPEYRELILTLLVTYDELKSSDLYLKDLIETQHIFLKMLEKFCARTGSVVVKSKSRSKKKKKSAKKSKAQPEEPNVETLWDEVAPQLTVILETGGDFTSDVVPFDAGSDIPIDEQKGDAMKNIQRKLRNGEFENAVGLLHACREVWPENDEFGNNTMSQEEEFEALKDIFFANISEEDNNPVVEEPSEEDDEEEDLEGSDIEERELKIDDFTKRLAHPKIVRACSLALKAFESNSATTNNCIVKLLHRIAFDGKMYVMLFQLSIFRTFQNIFKLKELPQYKELVKFAIYVIRQFLKVAEKNKKVFLETLFWKSNREAYEIEEGYDVGQKQPLGRAWTEEEEDELRRLFIEHREKQIEEDVVDWIVDNLIDQTRNRKQVLRKLKELMLIIAPAPKSSVRAPKAWGDDEEEELRELFEQFKDAHDPVGCIMERMSLKRPKNRIIEKLLVMGVIQDRKEVYKKRSGKKTNINETNESDLDEDVDLQCITSNTSSQSRNQPQPRGTNQITRKKKSVHKVSAKQQMKSDIKITKLLLEMEDLNDALDWLKDCLSDAIECFEDAGDDDTDLSLPLIPIMDYASDAMENEKFLKLLKVMGILEPEVGQEIYWRIPSTHSINTLKHYMDILTRAIDKTLTLPEDIVENQSESRNEHETSTSDKRPKKNSHKHNKTFSKKQFKKSLEGTTNNDNEESDLEESVSVIQSQGGDADSVSSEDLASELVSSNSREDADGSSNEGNGKIKNRRHKLIDSDSEDDAEEENQNLPSALLGNNTREYSGESPNGRNNKTKKQSHKLRDSDSEGDDEEKSENLVSELVGDNGGEYTRESPNDKNNKIKRRSHKIIDSDSENSSDEAKDNFASNTVNENNTDESPNVSDGKFKKRSRKIINSDSEADDNTEENNHNVKTTLNEAGENGESDTDRKDCKRATKRLRLIDSDEEY